MLETAARENGTILDFRAAGPAERTELLRSREVRAALVAVPPDAATWVVPLGVASTVDTGRQPLHLDTLRPGRTRRSFRRIWLQPEDDVPHIRDRLEQLGHREALVPAQVAVATSLTTALSDTLRTDNLLLCPPTQAAELELHWRPIAGSPVARGFTASGDGSAQLREQLWRDVALCLGVEQR
jgi:hypothetical protein